MRHARSSQRRFLAALITTVLTAACFGQEYRGRIQGVVSDATDAIIAGASLTLTNVNTAVSTVRMTDAYGRYLFDLVEPGAYTVTAESPGFRRFVQENVLVQNRGDITVNVKLQLGAVAETVKVTEAPADGGQHYGQEPAGGGAQSVHPGPSRSGGGQPLHAGADAIQDVGAQPDGSRRPYQHKE
jgi:hypothetical protein